MTETSYYGVLRCKSSATLKIAEELRFCRLDAWSPVYRMRVRQPRSRAVREEVRPAMPSFVFVAYPDLERAVEASACGLTGAVTLFVFNRIVARVRSDQLTHLKSLEEKQEEVARFPLGARVVVRGGHFLGFAGVVVMWDGMYHTVQLDHRGFHLKIPPFLLAQDRA